MNDEKKEAIIKLKHYINMTPYWKQEEYTSSELDYYIKIALNYIDELQEENKKLKEKLHKKNERIIELNKLLEDKE